MKKMNPILTGAQMKRKSVAKGNFLSFSAPCGDILPCLDKYTIR